VECQSAKLFEGISAENCRHMLECLGAWEASYTAGQMVLEYNDRRDSVGVLLSGSAELVRVDSDGNRTVLEALAEGDVFGEALAFSGEESDCIVVECLENCRVLFMKYGQITKRCENACIHHSVLVQNLFQMLSIKTLRLSERVEVLACRSIREKLLHYFKLQAAHEHSNAFVLPFSLSTLADYIGADRSAMMREMKKLREEGVISTEGRAIKLFQA